MPKTELQARMMKASFAVRGEGPEALAARMAREVADVEGHRREGWDEDQLR